MSISHDEQRQLNKKVKRMTIEYSEELKRIQKMHSKSQNKMKCLRQKCSLVEEVASNAESRYRVEIRNLESKQIAYLAERKTLLKRIKSKDTSIVMLQNKLLDAIDSVSQEISVAISDEQGFASEELLRWKVIRSQLTITRQVVAELFREFTGQLETLQKDISELSNTLEKTQTELHLEQKLLFREKAKHCLVNIIFRSDVSSQTGSHNKSKHNGQLLLSATNPKTAVQSILSHIKSYRQSGFSLLNMICCSKCGFFFIDADPCWPNRCEKSEDGRHVIY